MIIFYEKPGCITNTRQKKLLMRAGFDVDARDMRTEDWGAHDLRSFFGDMAVVDWFNKASPKVKSGEVDPETIDETQAIKLMIEDPLLIRRPLLKTDLGLGCGFEADTLNRLGLSGVDADVGREGCSNDHAHPCPEPKEA